MCFARYVAAATSAEQPALVEASRRSVFTGGNPKDWQVGSV